MQPPKNEAHTTHESELSSRQAYLATRSPLSRAQPAGSETHPTLEGK